MRCVVRAWFSLSLAPLLPDSSQPFSFAARAGLLAAATAENDRDHQTLIKLSAAAGRRLTYARPFFARAGYQLVNSYARPRTAGHRVMRAEVELVRPFE